MKCILIAGTHSGCGKTTVTLGVLATLSSRGVTVQSFKAGPDFIDAGIHRLATGRQSINLDLWMCGDEGTRSSFCRYARMGEMSVVEGVMGLFDGDQGTSALAYALHLPVILVVDAYGMAESAGALIHGYSEWAASSGIALAGIIFNRVGSERHFDRLKSAVRNVEVLGYVLRDADIEIPSRHLGLTTASEMPMNRRQVESLADKIEEHVSIDRIIDLADSGDEDLCERFVSRPGRVALTVRIAVARDVAFSFYYDENLDLLRDAGAEIIFFSPLWDSDLPADIDAIYLGGGYPELYARQLTANATMLSSIGAWAKSGRPIYAECGGLMYLSRGIQDSAGFFYEMAGIFPFETIMQKRRNRLGYREIRLRESCILGRPGAVLRGHEFHYSDIPSDQDMKESNVETIYDAVDAQGRSQNCQGYRVNSVLASYVHVHFGSNQRSARHFINFIKEKAWTGQS